MPPIRIQDAADPRIADYRNVPDADLLRRRGLFVAENRLVVRTLLASARFRTRSVLVTDAAYDSMRDALGPIERSVPVYVCPKSLMEPISGFHIHRGCLALGERPAPVSTADLLRALPDARRMVVLEAITNADNMGGIFRNAHAFATDAVIVGPRCCDPLYRKAIRVSIGGTLVVPFAVEGVGAQLDDDSSGTQVCNCQSQTGPHWLEVLQRAGFTLVALTPAEDAVDLDDFAAGPRPDRIALVVGNEGEGLSEATQDACDLRVRIAMTPGVDSINAGTATGIALHRVFRPGT